MDIVIVLRRDAHLVQEILPGSKTYACVIGQFRAFHLFWQIRQMLDGHLPLAYVFRQYALLIREAHRDPLFVGDLRVSHGLAVNVINHIHIP